MQNYRTKQSGPFYERYELKRIFVVLYHVLAESMKGVQWGKLIGEKCGMIEGFVTARAGKTLETPVKLLPDYVAVRCRGRDVAASP